MEPLVIDGVRDTCFRLCFYLSTCTVRDISPLCCQQIVTVSTETVTTSRAASCPLCATGCTSPSCCLQSDMAMFNEMYVPKTRYLSCSSHRSVKVLTVNDVCCTQPARCSAEELWLISQFGQLTFLFSKMCRSSLGPTKLPVRWNVRALMQGKTAGAGMEMYLNFAMSLCHVQRHVCTYLEVVCNGIEGRGAAVEVQFHLVLTSTLGAGERLASRYGRFTMFLRITDFIILHVCYLQCLAFCLYSLASSNLQACIRQFVQNYVLSEA